MSQERPGFVEGLQIRTGLAVERLVDRWTAPDGPSVHWGSSLVLAALIVGGGFTAFQQLHSRLIVNQPQIMDASGNFRPAPGLGAPSVSVGPVEHRDLVGLGYPSTHADKDLRGVNYIFANYISGLNLTFQYDAEAEVLRDPRVGVNYPLDALGMALLLPLEKYPEIEEYATIYNGFVIREMRKNGWLETYKREQGQLRHFADVMSFPTIKQRALEFMAGYPAGQAPSFEQILGEELSVTWVSLMGKGINSNTKLGTGTWWGLSEAARKIVVQKSPIRVIAN